MNQGGAAAAGRLLHQVIIAGAGPVGLSAAIDLAWRGVNVVVVESRYAGEPPPVKCNHISARSMEIMRRWGLAAQIRRAGLPSDYPNDVTFGLAVVEKEISRIPIPSVDQRRAGGDLAGYPDADWPTPEPPHRINQLFLEPILFNFARAQQNIRFLNRTTVEGPRQNEDGVVVTVRDLDSDRTTELAAAYLIGCDGARSTVRRAIGAKFEGDTQIARNLSTHIRAPSLLGLITARRKPAWMSQVINPRRSGSAIAIDGKEQWLVHCRVKDSEPDFDAIDRDLAIRTVLGVDADFTYAVLGKEDWVARRLVVDKMRDRRVFICGDAAHIWIPVAGYGMNCGIADATNLTWMLAGVVKGWAPPALLDAFEQERHPITEQVSRFVAGLGVSMTRERLNPPAGIDEPGRQGDDRRAAFGQQLYDMNVSQFCCAGLNFGYFYDKSPIIAYDGEAQPGYTMATFQESTVPGCRLPHFWLQDGRSLYDALGPDYTLLVLGGDTDAARLSADAAAAGFPLTVADLRAERAPATYKTKLVLARPDQHVGWRGDALPADLRGLFGFLAGNRLGQPGLSPAA